MAVKDDAAAELAGWLTDEHTRLARVWFGTQRYVMGDVDAFVSDMAARLGRGELPDPAWVRATRLRTTRDLRPGYRLLPVDDLLSDLQWRLRAARSGTELAPGVAAIVARIEHARFRRTWRGGYDMEEVDTFLDHAAEMLWQGNQPGAVPAFGIRGRGYQRRDVDAFTEELRGCTPGS
jgi:DivIVA domain-containing protein